METPFSLLQVYGVILRSSRADNSVASGPIWPKLELIHDSMHVLITCKFEKKDQLQPKRGDVHFLDDQGQLSQRSDLTEIQTHLSFYAFPHYLQV